jgi:hypothetical protein
VRTAPLRCGADDPTRKDGMAYRIDEEEVTLAFYGSIVYLAVVSSLAAQRPQPAAAVAIAAVVSTATVLFIAHAFAALVPRAAKAGRLHRHHLGEVLRHDAPLLVTCAVPLIPLVLAGSETIAVDTGYRLSVCITIALLFALATMLGRRDGLAWPRAIGAAAVIIVATTVVIWLESHVH